MLTRLQVRIIATNAVVLNSDLLSCILSLVRATSPRYLPRDVIPRVCVEWHRTWNILVSEMSPYPDYRFGAHLSIVQRETRVQQLAYVKNEFHRITKPLQGKCMRILRCNRDGVPTLLGHMVIYMAFSLTTRFDRPVETPPKLWEYIVKLRTYIAAKVSAMPSSSLQLLPFWFRIHPEDPLHAALLV